MSDETKPEDESTIEPIAVPPGGFSSDVPPYLLAGKSDAEEYIINTMSQMSAYIKWSAPILVSSNAEARKTNGRLRRVEAWRSMWSSWWALALGAFAVIGAIAGLVEVVQFIRPYLH